MKRRSMFGTVSFAIVTALVMMSQPVLAQWVLGAEGYGSTSVGPGGCSATVDGYFRSPVSDGDDVTVLFHISWADNRQTHLIDAIHYFNLTVAYSRSIGNQYAERSVPTSPGESNSATLNITVPNVQFPSTIFVNWYAYVNSPDHPQCFAQDSDSKTIIVYP